MLFSRHHHFDDFNYFAGNIKEEFCQSIHFIHNKLEKVKRSCAQNFRNLSNSLGNLNKRYWNFVQQMELPQKFVIGKLEVLEILSSIKNLSTEKRSLLF